MAPATAAPATNFDAWVWIKPPGESDGAASQALAYDPNDPNKKFDAMCDPTANSNYNTAYKTGAMANAPVAGRWFQAGFDTLYANAYPALP